MKIKNKIKYVISSVFAVLFLGVLFTSTYTVQASSDQPVTRRKINKQNVASNIKTCTPYSESATYETMGINVNYSIAIKGWQNGKCRVDFTSKIAGLGNSFAELFGDSSDAEIYSYTPVARCMFSKEQLASVGDSILQESYRNSGGKMLKDPSTIDIPTSFSDSDLALFSVVFGQQACTIQ